MFDSNALADAIGVIALILIAIGIALGGFGFVVLPWLFHHLSIHWI